MDLMVFKFLSILFLGLSCHKPSSDGDKPDSASKKPLEAPLDNKTGKPTNEPEGIRGYLTATEKILIQRQNGSTAMQVIAPAGTVHRLDQEPLTVVVYAIPKLATGVTSGTIIATIAVTAEGGFHGAFTLPEDSDIVFVVDGVADQEVDLSAEQGPQTSHYRPPPEAIQEVDQLSATPTPPPAAPTMGKFAPSEILQFGSADNEKCFALTKVRDQDQNWNLICAGDHGNRPSLSSLSLDGTVNWIQDFEQNNLAGDCSAVTTGVVGNTPVIYCGGRHATDAFLAQISLSGVVQWVYQIGANNDRLNPVGDDELIQSVTVNSSGQIYASGVTNGSLVTDLASRREGFLLKIAADGSLIWARQFSGEQPTATTRAAKITLDNSENVIVAEITGSIFELKKISPSGDIVWSKSTDPPFSGLILSRVVADNNRIIVVGQGGLDAADRRKPVLWIVDHLGEEKALKEYDIGKVGINGSVNSQFTAVLVESSGKILVGGFNDLGDNGFNPFPILVRLNETFDIVGMSDGVMPNIPCWTDLIAIDSAFYCPAWGREKFGNEWFGNSDSLIIKWQEVGQTN